MTGYVGRILRVDLDAGKLWDEPLNEEYARAFVGGSGLAARYIYDMWTAIPIRWDRTTHSSS